MLYQLRATDDHLHGSIVRTGLTFFPFEYLVTEGYRGDDRGLNCPTSPPYCHIYSDDNLCSWSQKEARHRIRARPRGHESIRSRMLAPSRICVRVEYYRARSPMAIHIINSGGTLVLVYTSGDIT